MPSHPCASWRADMPVTEFSEFTYGYAVIRETETFLTKHAGGLTKAPEQPS